jgi:hypothetical protein
VRFQTRSSPPSLHKNAPPHKKTTPTRNTNKKKIELLLLVGAPAQAFERLAGRFYAAVEWLERNALGWKLPGDEGTMPMHENLALYYPPEHAYTFDAYRYGMNAGEKETLRNYRALRWWERDGGFAGDVRAADVQALVDKYDPAEADRRAYQAAAAAGTLDEYWAARRGLLASLTGSAEPPVVGGAAAAAGARK